MSYILIKEVAYMLLSIIVPIYNTASYLEKCLHSIQAQTFTDFECLLIDDGSVDDSVKIAQSMIKNDHRFKLFQNKHHGLAYSLNQALSEAQGDYITFCDSDDCISSDAYAHLLPLIETHPDLIISNLYFNYANQKINNTNYDFSSVHSPMAIINAFPQMYHQKMMYYNVNKIYAKHVIDNLRFQDLTVGLDTIFNYQVFANCQQILFSPHAYYYYLQRPGSLVNHFDEKRLMIREKETNALSDLLSQWHCSYTSSLINEDWFNTLENTTRNVYMPIKDNQFLSSQKRLFYLKRNLSDCLKNLNTKLLTAKQLDFINLIESCIDHNDDQKLL